MNVHPESVALEPITPEAVDRLIDNIMPPGSLTRESLWAALQAIGEGRKNGR